MVDWGGSTGEIKPDALSSLQNVFFSFCIPPRFRGLKMGKVTSLTSTKIVELTKLDYMHRIQGCNSDRCVCRANVCTVKATVVLAVAADEDIPKSQGTYLEPYLQPVYFTL